MQNSMIWIAVGGNIPGAWGEPRDTFERAVVELERNGLRVVVRSGLFLTPPVGRSGQPDYLNAVIGLRASIAPAALLRLLKRIETGAGRRANGHWAPRPLDLDILDHGGRIIGRPGRARMRGRIVLPHPELEGRGFVLIPMTEVAPRWRHPRLGVDAETLLKRAPRLARGIRRLGDWKPR